MLAKSIHNLNTLDQPAGTARTMADALNAKLGRDMATALIAKIHNQLPITQADIDGLKIMGQSEIVRTVLALSIAEVELSARLDVLASGNRGELSAGVRHSLDSIRKEMRP